MSGSDATMQRTGAATPLPASARARLSLSLARVCWTAMIAFLVLHSIWLRPEGVSVWLPLTIQLAPWLACGPGLLRGMPRSHIFTCFLSLVWFCQGVLLAIQPQHVVWGGIEIILCTSLFWATVLYVRWHREPAAIQAN